MAATFTKTAAGMYRSSNLVPVTIDKTGSGRTPWVVGVTAPRDGRPFGYEVARFATLADAKTYAAPLINHPQGVAAAEGYAAMAARKLEGFGGHERARRHAERMAAYLTAWRLRRVLATGAVVAQCAIDHSEAASTLMPAREGGDGWPYFVDTAKLAERDDIATASELGIDVADAPSFAHGDRVVSAQGRTGRVQGRALSGLYRVAWDDGSTYDVPGAALTADDDAERTDKTGPAPGACPACAAQNERGPWPDHVAGCPDAPGVDDSYPEGDPCDCGTVRGPSGGYVPHAIGGHEDCTASELGELAAELADDTRGVSVSELRAVLAWCREWARDTQYIGWSADDDRQVLRAANHLIVGGLAFVLADVRHCAVGASPWADTPESMRTSYAARSAARTYAGGLKVTDAQALTLEALAEHLTEAWHVPPSCTCAPYGDAGDIVAVFTDDSPAPNPVVRMWAGGDSYSVTSPADWEHYAPKLAAEHKHTATEREGDAVYVIAPGGHYTEHDGTPEHAPEWWRVLTPEDVGANG